MFPIKRFLCTLNSHQLTLFVVVGLILLILGAFGIAALVRLFLLLLQFGLVLILPNLLVRIPNRVVVRLEWKEMR